MPLFRTTPPLGNNLAQPFLLLSTQHQHRPHVRKGIKKAKIRDEDNIQPAPPPHVRKGITNAKIRKEDKGKNITLLKKR